DEPRQRPLGDDADNWQGFVQELTITGT
ncbi:MAG: hypothetical protein ACI9U2_003591, partial [Bradymonadia bacterium]